jgi:hypothetical protein
VVWVARSGVRTTCSLSTSLLTDVALVRENRGILELGDFRLLLIFYKPAKAKASSYYQSDCIRSESELTCSRLQRWRLLLPCQEEPVADELLVVAGVRLAISPTHRHEDGRAAPPQSNCWNRAAHLRRERKASCFCTCSPQAPWPLPTAAAWCSCRG